MTEDIRALVEKWRKHVDGLGPIAATFAECADELEALLAASPEPSPPAWQPIETAPKGRDIILGRPVSDGVIWAGKWWAQCRAYESGNPTHWMPLPLPPAASGHDQ